MANYVSKISIDDVVANVKDNAAQTLCQGLRADLNSLSENVDTQVSTLDNKIDNINTSLTNKINTVNSELSNKINGVNTELSNKINGVNSELSNKINDVNAELSNDIESVNTTLSNSIDSVNTALTNDINELNSSITSINTEISTINSDIDNLQAEIDGITVNYENTYIVCKNSNNFDTINKAITQALTDGVSLTNPKTILVFGGDYNEKLVLNDVHGLNIIGVDRNGVKLHYNGSYPDCVVHAQGDITIKNISITQDNTSTYVIHCDPSSSDVSGTFSLINCKISNGTNAIGYGSGKDTTLIIKNCELSAVGEAVLYAHNSPYNKSNQGLIVCNNQFNLNNGNQFYLILDDAGNTAGVTSKMNVLFSGNYTNYQGWGKMKFRKNTSDTSLDTTYIPLDDSNIKFNANSRNNSGLCGINYNEGIFTFNGYIIFPSTAVSNYYETSIPMPVDTKNYTVTLIDATIPGVGSITGDMEMSGLNGWGVNIRTKNGGIVGRSIAVTAQLKCK